MENIDTLHFIGKMSVPFLSVELLTYKWECVCWWPLAPNSNSPNIPCFCVCVCVSVFNCVKPNITLNTKGHDHFRIPLDGWSTTHLSMIVMLVDPKVHFPFFFLVCWRRRRVGELGEMTWIFLFFFMSFFLKFSFGWRGKDFSWPEIFFCGRCRGRGGRV
jgi:hypothetical protein